MKFAVMLVSLLTLLSACDGNIEGENYLKNEPKLVLEEYFNGHVDAWGIIQDRSGNVISRFDATIIGSWKGNEGTLEEEFTYYDSNEKQYRTWIITKIDDTRYEGRAGDIIGTAIGKSFGNALFWTYEMDVPVDGTTYRLTFDDWIWGMNDGVVINRSYLKKYGVTVAEITIFMKKKD